MHISEILIKSISLQMFRRKPAWIHMQMRLDKHTGPPWPWECAFINPEMMMMMMMVVVVVRIRMMK